MKICVQFVPYGILMKILVISGYGNWPFMTFDCFIKVTLKTGLTHLSRMEYPSVINWNSPFLF